MLFLAQKKSYLTIEFSRDGIEMEQNIEVKEIKGKYVKYLYIIILMNERQYTTEFSGMDHVLSRKISFELGESRLLKL